MVSSRAGDNAGTDDVYAFAAETPPPAARGEAGGGAVPLTILTVDDDREFQRSLQLALGGFQFQTSPLRILSAGSATEAAKVLSATPEVAVIVLDVVMETDDAGLRLVKSVREVLGNAEVRIILVTGQPGMAPMTTSLNSLDISDYWLKTDLTYERLQGILTSNLRTWEQIRSLGRARRGLQTIVEASNSLNRARDLADFSARMLRELARLLHLDPDGIVCAQEGGTDESAPGARVVGAAGRHARAVGQPLASLDDAAIRELLGRCLADRSSIETGTSQVLFFPGTETGPRAAAYIETDRVLDDTERELLRVFASNVNTGLINVALTSRLDRIAYEDALLAMPNANALLRHLETIFDMAAPRDRTLLFIELDQYSASCLSLGIEQGDLMLKRMAARLRAVFPPPSVVARLHDETFAILGQSALLSEDRIARLESYDPDDPAHTPFISIRAARVDLDSYAGSARTAMAVGSLLLQRARLQGLNQLVDYRPSMEIESNRRFTRSRELYHALQGDEINIELQPQIDMASGRIVGAEALARWTRGDGTRVPPIEFIPMAEANGLIVPVGRRVIELACQALVRLASAGFPDIGIAVNVSTLQLARRDFIPELLETLKRHGVAPARLELEITESAAMGDYQANGEVLRVLRDAGFPIAIDDFGTGYSSLAYLRALPATTLKVDRSFVNEIGVVPGPRLIADMIIQLGLSLGMGVLAEGVETQAQADWLLQRSCALAQGYLFGKPESFDAFLQRLRG